MALRLALRRMASPLGLEKANAVTNTLKSAGESVKSFSPGAYFEEKYFWNKANVGPFFLLLLFTPTLYRSFKDFYWTRQLRTLNTEEIISDRYEWLRLNMLRDEVDAALLKKVPAGGVQPLELGPSSPP
eukprot:TRINITY_DN1242_c0_g1_i1.p2 TRINITY_DN1242_c0_g1~~TRINITY_DN1242_c0_g1_i1.p2  ORF type:complete len:129 (+),score=35.98 TRINITY_DN1242_c0_g1_i1:68-454(+)